MNIDLDAIAKLYSTLPPWAVEPGLKPNIPESDYHGFDAKALISKSALDIFSARSPRHFAWSLFQGETPPTPQMVIGSAAHALILEGEEAYRRRFVVLPDFGDLRSSTNRGKRDDWMLRHADGKTAIKNEDHAIIVGMANAVREHPAARRLLADGQPEVTATWTDRQTGRPCKARADWLHAHAGLFVDLKTTDDASPEAWARKAASMRYHVQDAFYSDGFDAAGAPIEIFAFVVVERAPPHGVAVYVLDDTAKLKGEELYMAELRSLDECIKANRWPGYNDDRVHDLTLPGWATQTVST